MEYKTFCICFKVLKFHFKILSYPQELRRQTCKDLMEEDDEADNGSKKRETNNGRREATDNEEEDSKSGEERDAAVLCGNAQCLGSLLQSWVVESFLEVVFYKM